MTDVRRNHPLGLDDWIALREYTTARIAIGRVGCGLPLKAHLEFLAAHARARDAVHAKLDVESLTKEIANHGWPFRVVRSAASDRELFLRQPNLGRKLAAESEIDLSEPAVVPDIVIVIGDGLSSTAVERNALPVLRSLWVQLNDIDYKIAPVVVATQARVAVADHIGGLLQARLSIMMIGERPGLSAADSLSLYITYKPCVGRVDSERNCISNIHANGTSPEAAAAHATALIRTIFAHRSSGVSLNAIRAEANQEAARRIPPCQESQ